MELVPTDPSWTAWLLPLAIACACGFAAAAVMAWALRRTALAPPIFKVLVVGEFFAVAAAVLYVASIATDLPPPPIL